MTTPAAAAIVSLAENVRGTVLTEGDRGYDESRSLWNAMIDRKPAVIVQCAGTRDVVHAVHFARENRLPLSVKAGGHGVAGKAVCDGGVMIDLSRMSDVVVDPASRTARVGGGATLGQFDAATQRYGLATTAGVATTTGIAGLTLGGGLGMLMRRFGLTCDNLLSAEVVTAEGEILTASETECPDLFWALRGGGGNFGVVTSFTFRLHPVGPVVVGGFIAWPADNARAVLRHYRACTEAAPEDLTTYGGLRTDPEGRSTAGFAVCYTGPLDRADAVLAPIRALANPIIDTIGPMPYVELQSMFMPQFPYGESHFWKSSYLDEMTDAFIDELAEQFLAKPHVTFSIEHLQGAMGRVDPAATAFPDRTAKYTVIVSTAWADPAETEWQIADGRAAWTALQPFARDAVYVNYMDTGDEDRIKTAFGPNYQRLAEIKAKYDPDNLFSNTQNISPANP